MIGKNTKVYTELSDWLKQAGMGGHELEIIHNLGTRYSVFLDRCYFAEYESAHKRLTLCGSNCLYRVKVHAEKKELYGAQHTLPATAIIIEI